VWGEQEELGLETTKALPEGRHQSKPLRMQELGLRLPESKKKRGGLKGGGPGKCYVTISELERHCEALR